MDFKKILIAIVLCVCCISPRVAAEGNVKPMDGVLILNEVTGVYMGLPVRISDIEIKVKYSMWLLMGEPVLRYAVKYQITDQTVFHIYAKKGVSSELLNELRGKKSSGGRDISLSTDVLPLTVMKQTRLSSGYISFRKSSFGNPFGDGTINGFFLTELDASIWGDEKRKTMSFPGSTNWGELFDIRGHPYPSNERLHDSFLDPYPIENRRLFLPASRQYLPADTARETWKALQEAYSVGEIDRIFEGCKVYPDIDLNAVFAAAKKVNPDYEIVFGQRSARAAEVGAIYTAFNNARKQMKSSGSDLGKVRKMAKSYKEAFASDLSRAETKMLDVVIFAREDAAFTNMLHEFIVSHQDEFVNEDFFITYSEESMEFEAAASKLNANSIAFQKWKAVRGVFAGPLPKRLAVAIADSDDYQIDRVLSNRGSEFVDSAGDVIRWQSQFHDGAKVAIKLDKLVYYKKLYYISAQDPELKLVASDYWLRTAVESGSLMVVKWMLSLDVDYDLNSQSRNQRFVLRGGGYDGPISPSYNYGPTLLDVALFNNDAKMVSLLRSKGAKIGKEDDD